MTGLLERLAGAGVTLEVEGEGLRIRAATPPPADLKEEIRQNKHALLEHLHRASLTTRLLETGKHLGWKPDTPSASSGQALQGWQDWAATAPLDKLRERVEEAEGRLAERQALTRDANTDDCPIHWLRTPDLPPKGQRVQMVDSDGFGCVYKVKLTGVWYVIKFLPPFDGRVSLRDEAGKTWVLPGLEHIPGLPLDKERERNSPSNGPFLNPTTSEAPLLHPSNGQPLNAEPLEEPPENPRSDERKIAELVARYQAGQFSPKVRARLAEIFEQNPPDAEARVLRACEHLGITGEGLEEADGLAQAVYGR